MTEDFYIDYFTNMAQKVKAISDDPAEKKRAFFVIEDMDSIPEVQEAIRSRLKPCALLLEEFDDDLTDNNADNHQEFLHGAFAVIIKVGQGTAVDRRSARKTARAAGKLIIAEMKREALDGVLSDQGIIVKIQSKGFGVGPVADNYYGWRYTFTWQSFLNTARDPNDFNS